MIILRSLGSAEIESAVTTLTPSQEVVFAAALYMVLERGKRVSRNRLASLLWPSVPEKARAHRLRQTVLQLKKLGIRLVADRDNLLLPKQDARSDSDDLAFDHPALSPPQASLEFLPGYTPRLSEALRDWIDAKRTEVHAAATSTLIHDLERARLRADWVGVERIAAACLGLDAYNETAILAQAEATAMRGSKRKAMSILDRYIADVGIAQKDLQLPATLLRRRISERVAERPPILNVDPPFVGREKEAAALIEKLNEARAGHGSAALIIGEPGIGKSRLTAEVKRFAELQGSQVQVAACRRTDVDRPLSIFVDIVPQLREMPGALGCAPESFASLKRLTELEDRRQIASSQSESDMLFQRLRAALFDLFDSVAEERSLLVVIEDIQWLDEASSAILARMIEQCATKRLFFLFNSRPISNGFVAYVGRSQLDTVSLGPLKAAACEALLHSVASSHTGRPDRDFTEWCLAVAEGNPFFLQELARQWLETGRRYEAPSSVTKVLQERISRLSEEALQVLQACAILGEHATLERLETILEYPSHQLLSAVERLSKAAMLRVNEDASGITDQQLHVQHDFLTSVAINSLAPVSRAFLHRRSAEVLEPATASNGVSTNLLWACANHRHNAGDKKRALALRLICAKHLVEMGLASEACARYEDALTYCSSDDERLAVLAPHSIALQLKGEWVRTKETLRACVRLQSAVDHSDQHNEFEVLYFQAHHRSTLDYVRLLQEVLPCVESLSASAQHRVSAGVVALKLASDVGPSSVLDKIYAEISPLLQCDEVDSASRLEAEIIYRTMRGSSQVDLEMLERFIESARSLHGEMAYSHALLASSSACRIGGEDEHAKRFADLAFDHAMSNKFQSRLAVINLHKIRLYVGSGEWVAARAALCTLDVYPIAEDDWNTRAEWDFFDGRVALQENDLDRAEAAISTFGQLTQTVAMNKRAGCLALIIRVGLARAASAASLLSSVQELKETHRVNRDIGNQDFETHALFLGLCAIGEAEEGYQLLSDYVQKYRHSRRKVSSDIKSALYAHRSRLKLASKNVDGRHDVAYDTACRSTEPLSGVRCVHSSGAP